MGKRRIWLIIIGILIAGGSITWGMERFVSSHGVDTAAVVGLEAGVQAPAYENPYLADGRMKSTNGPENAAAPAGENNMPAYQAAGAETEKTAGTSGAADAGAGKEAPEDPGVEIGAADNGIAMFSAEADQEIRGEQAVTEEQAAQETRNTQNAQGGREASKEGSLAVEEAEADATESETVKSPLSADPDELTPESGEKKLSVNTVDEWKNHLDTVLKEAEKYEDDPSASQASRQAAADYVWSIWDKELNTIYAAIRDEMDEETAEALRRDEVEWLKKRDLAADKAGSKVSGTPGQNAEYIRASANETKARCYKLLETYGTYLDKRAEEK